MALEKQPWMPFFKFVQGSHHKGVSNVDGATEVVHWVVKGKPFSIRISEVPSPVVPSSAHAEDASELQPSSESDLLLLQWQDISFKAEVVYSKTRRPVKVATGPDVVAVESSVTPPNPHNHRRSSANNNLLETEALSPSSSVKNVGLPGPVACKLTQGAGLELHVRLHILSSHLQNVPFCLNIKLYLRNHCVADWYSATIRSVSKWDKVRHMQDSVVSVPHYTPPPPAPLPLLPTPSSAFHSHSTTSNTSAPSMQTSTTTPKHNKPAAAPQRPIRSSISTRFTRASKASQMPVSSSISKVDPHHMDEDETEDLDSTTTTTTKASMGECSMELSDPSTSTTTTTTTSSSRLVSPSSILPDLKPERQTYSKSSHSGKKKKKASGEEVFDLMAQIEDSVDALERLSRHTALASPPSSSSSSFSASSTVNSKKRKATWDAAISALPTEEEAAFAAARATQLPLDRSFVSSQSSTAPTTTSSSSSSSHQASTTTTTTKITSPMAKKTKLSELSHTEQTQSHLFQSVATPAPPSSLAHFEHRAEVFLQLVESMPLSDVRIALTNVLLTRPDLKGTLRSLMTRSYRASSSSMSPHANHQALSLLSGSSPAPVSSTSASASASLQDSCILSASTGILASNTTLWGLDERYDTSLQFIHHEPANAVVVVAAAATNGAPTMTTAANVSHFADHHDDAVASSGYTTADVPTNPPPTDVLSPYALEEEEDSTTLGSPHSHASSWGENDWSYDDHHPTSSSSSPSSSLHLSDMLCSQHPSTTRLHLSDSSAFYPMDTSVAL